MKFKKEEFGPVNITKRERQVLIFLTEGFKNAEIATLMNITEHVVKNHIRSLYDRTGLSNRVELALWWIKNENAK